MNGIFISFILLPLNALTSILVTSVSSIFSGKLNFSSFPLYPVIHILFSFFSYCNSETLVNSCFVISSEEYTVIPVKYEYTKVAIMDSAIIFL